MLEIVLSPLVNVALNKPATQSSTSQWSASQITNEDAGRANNGDRSHDMWFHTAAERDPWWQVDLEDRFLVRRVVIFNRKQVPARLTHFSLLKSLDGHTWKVIFTKSDDSVFGRDDDSPYVINLAGDHLARFLRVRLDGRGILHFNECEVYGDRSDPVLHARIVETEEKAMEDEAQALRQRQALPQGRNGQLIEIEDFDVFVDHDNYDKDIVRAMRENFYEDRERGLVKQLVRPGDRVLEVGTAIGIVSMAAARIVGPENVLTFDANPDIVVDAQANFQRNDLSGIRSRAGVLQNRLNMTDECKEVDFFIHEAFWASRLMASPDTPGIVRTIKVPVFCLEEQIKSHSANVIICDIEGGEVDLFMEADLSGIRLIIMETHYWAVGEAATDGMVLKLLLDGFGIDLGRTASHMLVLRRQLFI
jgi:FkbM family methyltransferase